MTKNMGKPERLLRVIAAVIISALYVSGAVSGTIGTILLIVGGVFLLTSVIGVCPLYKLLGISTCPTKTD